MSVYVCADVSVCVRVLVRVRERVATITEFAKSYFIVFLLREKKSNIIIANFDEMSVNVRAWYWRHELVKNVKSIFRVKHVQGPIL